MKPEETKPSAAPKEEPKPPAARCRICDSQADADGNCIGLLKGISFNRRMHGLESFP